MGFFSRKPKTATGIGPSPQDEGRSASAGSGSSSARQSPSPTTERPALRDNRSSFFPRQYVTPPDQKHEFKSYRLMGQYEQPWADDKRMHRTKYNSMIVYGFAVLGVALSGFYIYTVWKGLQIFKHEYCLVLDEDFKTLDTSVWNHEIQIGGYGQGSFDWTTADPTNSFVDADGLHIVPTLTNESTAITNDEIMGFGTGYTLNLTAQGVCTDTLPANVNVSCAIHSNSTTGYTLPPVRSARMTTQGKKSIKYGRVEVVAKMPVGDWLWPAIWMMPESSVYGGWPASGEIDLAELRGNAAGYPNGGRDVMTSTFHWGPTSILDAYWRTIQGFSLRRTDFTQQYHTYGLEWSEDYLYTYVDSKLTQILYMSFSASKTLWDRGGFASATTENNTLLTNPWIHGSYNAPFDQEFYLILNVAVGSLNGWFPDSVASKPWVDASTYLAPGSFWEAVSDWLPTWGSGNARGMTIKSVKMWQQGACA